MVRVFLKKDIPNVGKAGQIKNVADGYASNFLVPHQLAVVVTAHNEAELQKRFDTIKTKEVVTTVKSSQLADRIAGAEVVIKRKLHDDGKLYGAISQQEVVDVLKSLGIVVAKNQVLFDKSIKSKGLFSATIKLSSSLQPSIAIKVVAEASA
ncbi:MAG: 50S ribosomal protein L9 [candidate division TM6 bacterium GW2011_GWF2_43_17]|nr:MAG: 50S ribosomal protein L9 [candidate division TM6 bacterium GW2011_GWF2_43_17]HAU30412.1 50S ribosomal protein L9 [Candidatus Dependentiae bacterium]